MVDVSDIIIAITIETVIVCIATIIVTKFFIYPAMEVFVAAKAYFGFCDHVVDFEGRLQTGLM